MEELSESLDNIFMVLFFFMYFKANSIAIASADYIKHVDGSLNDVCKLVFTMNIHTPSSLI